MKSSIVFIFLFFCQLTSAQVLSKEAHLTTINFETKWGSIKIYLPTDLVRGDVVTTSINVTFDTFLSENELRKLKLRFKGVDKHLRNFQPLGNFYKAVFEYTYLKLGKITSDIEVTLADSTGELAKVKIPVPIVDSVLQGSCISPSWILTNDPLVVYGQFDGDVGTTNISLSKGFLPILAESRRQIICRYPDVPGLNSLEIIDGSFKCTKSITGIELSNKPIKDSLGIGEMANLSISLKGLQKLEDTIIFYLQNRTFEIVEIENRYIKQVGMDTVIKNLSNTQALRDTILPLSSDSLQYHFIIKSKVSAGKYLVDFGLIPPVLQVPKTKLISKKTFMDIIGQVIAGLLVLVIAGIAGYFYSKYLKIKKKLIRAPELYIDKLDRLIKQAKKEGRENAIVNGRAIVVARNNFRESLIALSKHLNSEIDRLAEETGVTSKTFQTLESSVSNITLDPGIIYQTIEVLHKVWPDKKDQIIIEIRKLLIELGLDPNL